MSGASLLLLSMYSVLNVVGPAGKSIGPSTGSLVMFLLITAGTLAVYLLHGALPRARRRIRLEAREQSRQLARAFSGPGMRRH